MKKGLIISVIVGVVVLLVLGFFMLTNNKGTHTEETGNQNSLEMLDCGMMQNPSCFVNRMNGCLPVSAKLTGTDGANIEVIILGMENGTCHFQRKVNNVANLNCYFSSENLNSGWNLIDQTFGNDKGLGQITENDCKPVL